MTYPQGNPNWPNPSASNGTPPLAVSRAVLWLSVAAAAWALEQVLSFVKLAVVLMRTDVISPGQLVGNVVRVVYWLILLAAAVALFVFTRRLARPQITFRTVVLVLGWIAFGFGVLGVLADFLLFVFPDRGRFAGLELAFGVPHAVCVLLMAAGAATGCLSLTSREAQQWRMALDPKRRPPYQPHAR